ncbi:dnaJ domain-containing protein [Phthorimaea operculella]|nr:dnaJ domain-containing protein [Phthorimaea operculella]
MEEEKKRDAEKCLQIAEIAFSNRNYVKAERLLLKAERLCPTSLAKQILKDVRAAQGITTEEIGSTCEDTDGGYNSESSNATFSGENQRTDDDREASDSCIVIAKSAIAAGRFDKAKNFLLKSIRLFPKNDTAKELLEKLDDLKENYSPTSYNSVGSSLGNKDEADKCVQIAEREYAACRLARAKRLLLKAERLFSTTRAKDLLRQIEEAISKGVKDADEGKPQKLKQARPGNHEIEAPKRSMEPTPEQVEAIRRVKEGKDDFEILGVKQQSSLSDVRKSFRRLTLLLHPDKNRAAGAKDAFMLASEAAERLKKKISSNGRRTM